MRKGYQRTSVPGASAPEPPPLPEEAKAARRITPPPISQVPLAPDAAVRSPGGVSQSISQRQAVERSRRRIQYWEDTPCWLVSMVVHLTLFVVLGLLTPAERDGTAIHLVLRPAAPEAPAQEATGAWVRQSQSMAQRPGQPEDDLKDADDSIAGESLAVADEQVWQEHAAQLSAKVQALQGFMQELSRAAAQAQSELTPTPSEASELASALVTVTGPDSSDDSGGGNTSDDIYAWGDSTPDSPVAPSDDEIVQRFILYDIGQLRGAAGQQARREFNALGPSAIPALVRGLNRSGSIRASCPVGVISSKLRSVMGRNHNPALVQYAIENLGRGVKPTDPHARRIEDLRDELRREFGSDTRGRAILLTAQSLERRGLRDAARRRYELLVSDYPRTEEGMIAQARLQAMGP